MFTVRIELRDHKQGDYDNLHEKMEIKGFSKTIITDDNERYFLPDAEYYYSGKETRGDVLKKAYDIADSVRKNPKVLVTQADGIRWKGLDDA